jgi:hypothetical protein
MYLGEGVKERLKQEGNPNVPELQLRSLEIPYVSVPNMPLVVPYT